jgi:hypothetical protein
MERRSTQRMMIALLIMLVGGAIFGVVRLIGFSQTLSDNPWQNYKTDLLARAHTDLTNAERLWNDHRLAHYRLTVEWAGPAPDSADAPRCQQDVEVRDEAAVTTYLDSCTAGSADHLQPMSPGWLPPSPRFAATVSQFFTAIEHDTSRIYWTAQGVGCDFITLEVSYDSQGGYPARMAYRVQPPPSQMGFPIDSAYFLPDEATPDPGGCRAANPVDGPIITLQLTPMR